MMTSYGWDLSWFYGGLKDGGSASGEVRYHIFDGDRMHFHEEYIETSGLKEAWNGWTPLPWADRIRGADYRPWAVEPKMWAKAWDEHLKVAQNTHPKMLRDGDKMLVFTRLNEGTYFPASDNEMIPVRNDLAEGSFYPITDYLPRFRTLAADPMYRLCIYQWPWGISTRLNRDAIKAHPEWFTHRQDGSPIIWLVAQQGGSDILIESRLTPEYDDWWIDNTMKMVKYVGLNMVYTDYKAVAPSFDWTTMTTVSGADQTEFFKRIWIACRKNGCVFWANDAWTPTPFTDVTFMEGLHRFCTSKDWREVAETFAVGRRYLPAEIPSILLYPDKPYMQTYFNAIEMLGFRGSHYPGPWAQVVYDVGSDMFGYQIADLAVKPCYWMDKTTHVEAYAMQRTNDKAVLLTFESHAAQAADVTISFDAKKAGLDVSGPLYAWYLDGKRMAELKEKAPAKVFTVKDARADLSVVDGRVQVTVKNVDPEVAKQLYVTANPALVWGIAGKDAQISTAYFLDTQAESVGAGKLTVNAERPSTIFCAVNAPEKARLLVDGKETQFTQRADETIKGIWFDVAAGRHLVEVR
jgi:hypothetical protein